MLGATILGEIDLSTVRGLESIEHHGPSTIGIDPIYRSKGKIPESFLRGAGVPENLITFMKSLTGRALNFYSCFISYSTKDQKFADRLHADLRAKGVRCWFAPHDIQAVARSMSRSMRPSASRQTTPDPFGGQHEQQMGEDGDRERSRQGGAARTADAVPRHVVPFDRIRSWKLPDADTGIDSAREIREYFIPDFSNWKDHDVYAKTFERLVRDLKASGAKAATPPTGEPTTA
jgi:hypothetical protein